jgi:hypothetical protein
MNEYPTTYTQQQSAEELIGNILSIAEAGHGHLKVLVSEAATAIQGLKDENARLRAELAKLNQQPANGQE